MSDRLAELLDVAARPPRIDPDPERLWRHGRRRAVLPGAVAAVAVSIIALAVGQLVAAQPTIPTIGPVPATPPSGDLLPSDASMDPAAPSTAKPNDPSAAHELPSPTAPTSEQPGGQPSAAPTAAPDHGAVLWGRSFVSMSVTESGKTRELLVGTQIKVDFEYRPDEASIVRWNAGCNTTGAVVRVSPDRLHLGPMASTAIGCDEERHQQDSWLQEFFGSDPTWRVDGSRLTLTSGGTTIVFEEIHG